MTKDAFDWSFVDRTSPWNRFPGPDDHFAVSPFYFSILYFVNFSPVLARTSWFSVLRGASWSLVLRRCGGSSVPDDRRVAFLIDGQCDEFRGFRDDADIL